MNNTVYNRSVMIVNPEYFNIPKDLMEDKAVLFNNYPCRTCDFFQSSGKRKNTCKLCHHFTSPHEEGGKHICPSPPCSVLSLESCPTHYDEHKRRATEEKKKIKNNYVPKHFQDIFSLLNGEGNSQEKDSRLITNEVIRKMVSDYGSREFANCVDQRKRKFDETLKEEVEKKDQKKQKSSDPLKMSKKSLKKELMTFALTKLLADEPELDDDYSYYE